MHDKQDNPYKAPETDLVDHQPDSSILMFERFSAWAVFGLSIVTLGIYPIYWMYSRAKVINLEHEERLSLFLLNALIGLAILSFAAEFFGAGEAAEWAYLIINLAYFVIYLTVLFKIRRRLEDIVNRSARLSRPIGSVATFFFHVIYLQYKINQCIDESEPSALSG